MRSSVLFAPMVLGVLLLLLAISLQPAECGKDEGGENIVLAQDSLVLSSGGKKGGDNIVIKDGHKCQCCHHHHEEHHDHWDHWGGWGGWDHWGWQQPHHEEHHGWKH